MLPNWLTLFRIVCAVAILPCLFVYTPVLYEFSLQTPLMHNQISVGFFVGGVIFCLAVLSDFLDGYLARKFQWVSVFGQIWDPLTDKVLTTFTFVSFAILQSVPFYLVLMLLLRDYVVDGYRMYLASKQIIIPAAFWGKAKTVMQMLALLLLFFVFHDINPKQELAFYLVQNLAVWLSVFLAFFSLFFYLYYARQKISASRI